MGAAPPPRDFAPGVRIDWPNLTVELDAEVVLRQGPLELFACSPNTKEHESILKVFARPMHIYQAMGLVGLKPGRPVRFDEKENRLEPPTGDALDIRVRHADEHGRTVFASPENWLSTSKPQPAELTLRWVFAGSYTLLDGRFAADIEGTVLCLVDFEAALIAIPALHSADNEQLWLVAQTDAIPPRGTKCTLLIRSSHRPAIRLDLLPDGTIRCDGRFIDDAKLAEILEPPPDDARPLRLQLCVEEGASDASLTAIVRKVKEKAGDRSLVETQRSPCRFVPLSPRERDQG